MAVALCFVLRSAKEGEISFALNPLRKGAMQMYLTVDDFCQICLVIIGALGLIVALIGLIHELNKKK